MAFGDMEMARVRLSSKLRETRPSVIAGASAIASNTFLELQEEHEPDNSNFYLRSFGTPDLDLYGALFIPRRSEVFPPSSRNAPSPPGTLLYRIPLALFLVLVVMDNNNNDHGKPKGMFRVAGLNRLRAKELSAAEVKRGLRRNVTGGGQNIIPTMSFNAAKVWVFSRAYLQTEVLSL